ncbi:MAG TPA: hypothetical protein VMT80_02115 [Candidatus Paceibacterota bacterium]|nr:hypothetical protein [Candidatus Paceibacterota bacterium]
MDEVQFDEPQLGPRPVARSVPSAVARLVISLGLAKDNAGAQKALLVITVVAVLATVFLWWRADSRSNAPVPLPTPYGAT